MIAKKSLGQNFLYDKNIVRKIVRLAEVKSGDLVLEIGPGQGILTEALLEAKARVIAVEADEDLIPVLQNSPLFAKEGVRGSFSAEGVRGSFSLLHGDILSATTWNKINQLVGKNKYSVVANIPYNITSPILETLFKTKPQPERLTLMVQREVADRILAKPPDMSVLAVACQLYSTGKKLMQVSRGSFRPAPNVDSTVIRLDLRSERLGGLDPEEILKIVKVGFSSRRKQLHGNLSKAGVCSSIKVKEILKNLDLPETARAENLTVEDWVGFCKSVKV